MPAPSAMAAGARRPTATESQAMRVERGIVELTIRSDRWRRPRNIDALAASIAELGLLHPPTVTPTGTVLAGARRVMACASLGWVTMPVEEVTLDALHGELVEIDENLCRDELTILERAEHLKRRKEIYEALNPEAVRPKGGRPRNDATVAPFSKDTAARAPLSMRTIQEDVRIATNLAAAVKEAIRGTDMEDSKRALIILARQDHAMQSRIVSMIADGTAKDVAAALRLTNRENKIDKIKRRALEPLDKGRSRFNVILADNPWRYDDATVDPSRQIENQYPTMALEEIMTLPVPKIAAGDAILFCWATVPMFPEALEVVKAWGFKYKSQRVWDKEKMGMGRWTRVQHEILIIATRGDMPTPKGSECPRSIYREPRGAHSSKPEHFAEAIELCYPELAKIELFRRGEARPGWSAWGNQTEEVSA